MKNISSASAALIIKINIDQQSHNVVVDIYEKQKFIGKFN